MFVDRILFPVNSLGPGNRLAIWVSGCQKHCEGCANPELWEQRPCQMISYKNLFLFVRDNIGIDKIDGITISGGEPFNQASDILSFIECFENKPELLIFSGYYIDEIKKDSLKNSLLFKTDVLIDGPYIKTLNDNKASLRGSTNQTIHFLNELCREKYKEYISLGRTIQNFVYDYNTISIGIHNSGTDSKKILGEKI